jgi:D-beta-D-heptose 7-phosphate kinase/D-beta-D-heptose 1-phosphate adenosyltransferase
VEEVLGGRIKTIEEIERAGKRLMELLESQNILVTRGEEGMSLFESGGTVTHLESMAEKVKDVSGAGDTVISTLTMSLAGGATVREASVLANCAAGVIVGAIGIEPIELGSLMQAARQLTDHVAGSG